MGLSIYDADAQLYLVSYSDGSTEQLSHYQIEKFREPSYRELLRSAKDDGERKRRSRCLNAFEKLKVVITDENS